MYLRIGLTVLLLLAASPVHSAMLRGIILLNDIIKGTPAPNVQIIVLAGGSNQTVSDTNGRFTLSFPGKQPGEMVELRVTKPGYVVVNDVQLRLPLPRDPDAEPLKLLLCKEGNREEVARRFYRLKSMEAIDKAYRKQLEDLRAQHQASTVAIAKLRKERDQAVAAAEKAAEDYARLKPDQTSDLYREAMSLFLRGNVAEALKVLDEEKLHRSLGAARLGKAMAEKAMAEAVQGYLLRARLLTTQFRFDEAGKVYQAAVDDAPDSFDAWAALATFMYVQNRYRQALPACLRALELARQKENKADVATTLNNLGILHLDQNRMEEARKAYDEALTIRRQLAKQNPEAYLPDLAGTLNNLGESVPRPEPDGRGPQGV
jgi:tetratricopeptide (TPR) repeat protein